MPNKVSNHNTWQVGCFDPKKVFTCDENGPVFVAKARTKEIAKRIVADHNKMNVEIAQDASPAGPL